MDLINFNFILLERLAIFLYVALLGVGRGVE